MVKLGETFLLLLKKRLVKWLKLSEVEKLGHHYNLLLIFLKYLFVVHVCTAIVSTHLSNC